MAVTSTQAAGQSAGSSTVTQAAKSGFSALDGTAFLKLLIAQLKNQDPTKPVDPTQYVAQLAQFSSVEQAVRTNTLIDGLITTTAISQAEGMIGRTVSSADGSVVGKVAAVHILSDGSMAILDDGREIKLSSGVKVF